MKIIAGLGNPGSQYDNTRHNVGFLAIDEMADLMVGFQNKHKALIQKTSIANEPVVLVKPQTYMNLSGESIRAVLDFYKVPLQNLIVFVDDINLVMGRVRIREKGSHGGQNGLKNIIQHCGPDFIRVRCGVGPVPAKWDLASFVLSKIPASEQADFTNMVQKAPEIAAAIIKNGLQEAMNQFNA